MQYFSTRGAGPATLDEALRAGNEHDTESPLLNKPFRLDELARRLRELLDAEVSMTGAAGG